jgi:hypothetical protein
MFADLELARRLERTEGLAGSAFVEARGGEAGSIQVGGANVMFDGPESPLTQTFALGMFEPATASVLAQVEEFFRVRNAPVNHEICPLAGVALMRTLAERGYRPCEASNVMFLELAHRPPDPVLNPSLEVFVASDHDADAYVRTAAEGWREAGEAAVLIAELARVMFAAKGYTGFLVYRDVKKDGRTIATAGLVIHDRVALLAGASTIPEDRGQGAQRAVLAARLRYATSAGCDLAMMVAQPGSASQRNAERHGFRIAYTRVKWRLD